MPDPNRLTVSATESPALLNASPYLTRWMLYQKFANGIETPRKATSRMDWGTLMQPLIIQQVAAERKLEVFANDETYVRRGLLGCTRDATVISPDHGPGALEIKCVFDWEVWGQKWGAGKNVPREIEIQLQQQMYVGYDENNVFDTGSFKWGLLVVWVCAELHYFERKPIPELWTALERAAIAFFSDVRSKREPDPVGVAIELPLLRELFPLKPDSVLDLSTDPDHVKTSEQVSLYKYSKDELDGHAAAAEAVRVALIALAKDNEYVKLPCGVSYRVRKSGKGKTIIPYIPAVPTAPPPPKIVMGV